jgi:hypothetical protein
MGNTVLYLRDGVACTFPVGTLLQVVYNREKHRVRPVAARYLW